MILLPVSSNPKFGQKIKIQLLLLRLPIVTMILNQASIQIRMKIGGTDGYLLGLQQVIDENSVFQSNLTFSSADGFLSDPYKTFDNRPGSRDAIAWLNRYIRYVESADASLHLDYRYFADSWDTESHTFEVAWYQPFLDNWMIRPSVRYYSQSGAEFFTGKYPPENFKSTFSADQRTGPFTSLIVGLKLVYNISETLELVCLESIRLKKRAGKLEEGIVRMLFHFIVGMFLLG